MAINYANKRKKGEEVYLTREDYILTEKNCEIRLDEVPLRYINTIEDSKGLILKEQLSGEPLINYFVVNYDTGIIKFNELNASNVNSVTINYYGTGSVWLAEDASKSATGNAQPQLVVEE